MSRAGRRLPSALAGAALAAGWLVAPGASAQLVPIPDNNWRQTDRHDALMRGLGKGRDEQKGYFELRLGPYLPAGVDSGDPRLAQGRGSPFVDVFGLDCGHSPPRETGSVSPRLYVGLEADYLPLRIPYVGALGIGGGWGFTGFTNQARFTGQPKCSVETTSLTIMPMHASIVARLDELMRRTGVPVVPYGKLGVGLTWWRVADDAGTEKICGTAGEPEPCKANDTPVAHADGLLPTLHLAAGVMLALDFIAPDAMAKLHESSGIGHIYVFGELSSDSIPLAANVLRVGATSWVAGLGFDL
jgi:hypothetical protein